jgi:hypothetical protein
VVAGRGRTIGASICCGIIGAEVIAGLILLSFAAPVGRPDGSL